MEGLVLFENFNVRSFRGEYSVAFGPWDVALCKELLDGDVLIVDRYVAELYPFCLLYTSPSPRDS